MRTPNSSGIAEQEVDADGGADHLGDIGRDDRDLAKSHRTQATGPGKASRQAWRGPARTDGKASALRLQDDRHDVRQQRDHQQRVAELGAAGDRCRPVARVHVADRDEVARPDKGQRAAE